MSKRYVVQVRVLHLNAPDTWENVQFTTGEDWMSRSKTTALNYAVTLVTQGETRPLRVGVSLPVYAVTPLPELNVAEAVEISKQITVSMSDEIKKHGYGDPGDDDYVVPSDWNDGDDDDDDDEGPEDMPQFELVKE